MVKTWTYNKDCQKLEETAIKMGLSLRITAQNYDNLSDTYEYYIELGEVSLGRGYFVAFNNLISFFS